MDAKSLPDLINEYRARRGLKRIPISRALTFVAQTHLRDLKNNFDRTQTECNEHSWSKAGSWSSCCYSNDPAQFKCMWDKPRQITNYKANGYEIVAHSASSEANAQMTPWSVVYQWADSTGHRRVMLNEDAWAKTEWKAMGAIISDNYASAWFGEDADP